jgi:hypothetical protein
VIDVTLRSARSAAIISKYEDEGEAGRDNEAAERGERTSTHFRQGPLLVKAAVDKAGQNVADGGAACEKRGGSERVSDVRGEGRERGKKVRRGSR